MTSGPTLTVTLRIDRRLSAQKARKLCHALMDVMEAQFPDDLCSVGVESEQHI